MLKFMKEKKVNTKIAVCRLTCSREQCLFYLIQFLIKGVILTYEKTIFHLLRTISKFNSTGNEKGRLVYLPIQFHLEGCLNQRVKFKCLAFVGWHCVKKR